MHFYFLIIFLSVTSGCAVELRDNKLSTVSERKLQAQSNKPVYYIKSSLIIDSQNSANKLESFERIIFLPNSKLITAGQDITLNLSEVVSDHGVITTFEETQSAPEGVGGRAGGLLKIKIKKLQGNLGIVMQGEHGGHGHNASNILSVAKKCLDKLQWPIPNFEEPCLKGDGLKGADGGPGGDGGDSGDLLIEIIDSTEGYLNVVHRPGSGGAGGSGGLGQQAAPAVQLPLINGSIFNLPAGQPGAVGSPGKNGNPGLLGQTKSWD